MTENTVKSVRYIKMKTPALPPLEVIAKRSTVRVRTESRLSLRPLEFAQGNATGYVLCNGIVREAAVQCCGAKTDFPKGQRSRVTLPAEINCDGCGTTYGMEQHNTAKIKIYGRE